MSGDVSLVGEGRGVGGSSEGIHDTGDTTASGDKFFGIGGGRICSDLARLCPNGKTVVEVPPDCHFQPCDDQCHCGDSCNKNGISGFCGPNGVCRTGLTHPPVCGGPHNCVTPYCPAIFCPLSQQKTSKDSYGCPKCPVCHWGSCSSDYDCPSGQTCVTVGLFKSCKPPSTQTCSPLIYGAADFSSSYSLSAGSALSRSCPIGQHCVNGHCQQCFQVDCIPPPCDNGHLVPGPLINGCPGCPRCSVVVPPNPVGGCNGGDCLPCCPPVERVGQPPCRDCGFRG